MPPPKKLDLVPLEIRQRLALALQERGFGDIHGVTEDLNFWLDEKGLELRVGKSAVGNFSQLLKTQRDAFAIAETLLADMDIEAESGMHRALMQMIAAAMFQLMQAVAEKGDQIDAKSLANLARTLKDLMHSAGLREKMLEEERQRVAKKAREEAQAEMAGRLDEAVSEAGLSPERAENIRNRVLGLRT
ncbi:DUF3486 family protein [Leisingera sp. M527]|uniref:DUF3486 family protein n=1 Tax=unclassified Leisingera TaxID=2614906 RepID=UPI0021A3E1DC|nr:MULTISPECIES: DUF3486 family protein [unclassified Leisingera]UWQ31279.1 DUF3486 family protein [Leisingera sp. M527]UWQ31327.1 DUF3486 family protein [Leisingera sp. M527]UWQ34580.1 DUF3486 family protein [Leisingera sp. M527]UWQ73323.1 DUF3486 family protein [Leisingera sp. M658]